MSIKILVIDDSVERLVRLKKLLEKENYEKEPFVVEVARNSDEGLAILDRFQPEIILLDVHMPQSHFDGWVTCVHIRRRPGYEVGKRGVIMFSEVRREMVDIDTGYYVGADDYIVTPFEDFQLVRAVKKQLHNLRRHTYLITSSPSQSSQTSQLDEDDNTEYEVFDEHLTICWQRHSVSVDGVEVRLQHLEYKLLEYLRNQLNKVCYYDELKDYAWKDISWANSSEEDLKKSYDRLSRSLDRNNTKGDQETVDWMPSDVALNRQISTLRKKLKNDSYHYITTQPKLGYMLERKTHGT